jgi:hypothetical protein
VCQVLFRRPRLGLGLSGVDAEGQEVASAAEPCYGVLVGRVLPRSEAEVRRPLRPFRRPF